MVVSACGMPSAAAGLHRRRLQPIDADRLLVAHLVLESDIDVLPALDHLLGGLGKARLVAVDRRDLEEARQEGNQAKGDKQRRRAGVRARRDVEQGAEPGAGPAGDRRYRMTFHFL